jgi:hypothetical protein
MNEQLEPQAIRPVLSAPVLQPTAWELVALYREAFGGRKFLLCLGCGIVSTILFAANAFLKQPLLSEAGYLTLIGGSVIAYITGRTVEAKNGVPEDHPGLPPGVQPGGPPRC